MAKFSATLMSGNKVWSVNLEDNKYETETGIKGGKMQSDKKTVKAGSAGRTADEEALLTVHKLLMARIAKGYTVSESTLDKLFKLTDAATEACERRRAEQAIADFKKKDHKRLEDAKKAAIKAAADREKKAKLAEVAKKAKEETKSKAKAERIKKQLEDRAKKAIAREQKKREEAIKKQKDAIRRAQQKIDNIQKGQPR